MSLDLEKYNSWVKSMFWLIIFAIAFVLMQKVMHPGWTIFGY